MTNNEKHEALKAMRKGTISGGRYWTGEERKKMEQMFIQGYGISEIALELNRSERATFQELQHQGCFPKIRRDYRKKNLQSHCLCPECIIRLECNPHNGLENSK